MEKLKQSYVQHTIPVQDSITIGFGIEKSVFWLTSVIRGTNYVGCQIKALDKWLVGGNPCLNKVMKFGNSKSINFLTNTLTL